MDEVDTDNLSTAATMAGHVMNRAVDIEDLNGEGEEPELAKENADTPTKLEGIVDMELMPIQGPRGFSNVCFDLLSFLFSFIGKLAIMLSVKVKKCKYTSFPRCLNLYTY